MKCREISHEHFHSGKSSKQISLQDGLQEKGKWIRMGEDFCQMIPGNFITCSIEYFLISLPGQMP